MILEQKYCLCGAPTVKYDPDSQLRYLRADKALWVPALDMFVMRNPPPPPPAAFCKCGREIEYDLAEWE